MLNVLKTITNISSILLSSLFFTSIIVYFIIVTTLVDNGVKIKFKGFSVYLLLIEYKRLAKKKQDIHLYIYYIFILIIIFMASIFFIGMFSAIAQGIITGNILP